MKILYFAWVRERIGVDEETVEPPPAGANCLMKASRQVLAPPPPGPMALSTGPSSECTTSISPAPTC